MNSICFDQKNIQYYSPECQDFRNQVFQRISNEFVGRNKSQYVDIKYDKLFPEVLKRPTTYNLSKLNKESDDTMFAAGFIFHPKNVFKTFIPPHFILPAFAYLVISAACTVWHAVEHDPCTISYDWSDAHMYNPSNMTNYRNNPYRCSMTSWMF